MRSSAVCTQRPSGECLYRGCHKKKKKTERKLCWEKAGSRLSRTHNKRLEIYDNEQDPEHWLVLNDAASSACLNWFYCHTSIGGTLPSFTSPQMIQMVLFSFRAISLRRRGTLVKVRQFQQSFRICPVLPWRTRNEKRSVRCLAEKKHIKKQLWAKNCVHVIEYTDNQKKVFEPFFLNCTYF